MATKDQMKQDGETTDESARKPTAFGGMDEHKKQWLNSLALRDVRSAIDCDPTVGLVQWKDGSLRRPAERYSRVMGYHRPVSCWNVGKQQEFLDRQYFQEAACNLSSC